MREPWRKLALAIVIVIPIVGLGVAAYRVYEQGRVRSAARTADVNRQMALDCDPWRSDQTELSQCADAWSVWQRCRRRLEGSSGVICTHPKFRFEERLKRQVDEAIRPIDSEMQSGVSKDQR